jgi:hypothetical protein
MNRTDNAFDARRPVVVEEKHRVGYGPGSVLGAGSCGHSPSTLQNLFLKVAVLTGGDDKPYVLGLVEALTSEGVSVDVIGSDDLAVPELLGNPRVNFLNLRGDQAPQAMLRRKIIRLIAYYCRLIWYALAYDVLQTRWKASCVDCT